MNMHGYEESYKWGGGGGWVVGGEERGGRENLQIIYAVSIL